MILEGTSKKGKRVAVNVDQVGFATEQDDRTLLSVNGQWVTVDVAFAEVVRTLQREGTDRHMCT